MNQESSGSERLKYKPKIVAAIPCFNEARCIGSVVIKAKKFVDLIYGPDDYPLVADRNGAGESEVK